MTKKKNRIGYEKSKIWEHANNKKRGKAENTRREVTLGVIYGIRCLVGLGWS